MDQAILDVMPSFGKYTVVRLLFVDACFPPFVKSVSPTPSQRIQDPPPPLHLYHYVYGPHTFHPELSFNRITGDYFQKVFKIKAASAILTEFYVYVSIQVSDSNIYQQYLSGAWTLEINFKL